MKNIPEKIYLQHGLSDEEMKDTDFNEFDNHGSISWCSEQIEKNDLEYIHIDAVQKLINFFAKSHVDKKYIKEHLKKIEDESNKP